VLFTGLVILFLFVKPEGLFGSSAVGGLDAWRGRGARAPLGPK
jgi:hypothetical protein